MNYHKECNKRWVEYWKDNQCIGDFYIYGTFGKDTCSLSISVQEEHQGNGYSRMLIREMICQCESEEEMNPDQLLFIDADASAGFWDHIGMKENRYGYDYKGKRQFEGRGYEKVITWRELKKFVH
jgi:hypothetical protein